MLEQHDVAAYLLERRLISRRSIVSGQLRILDASRRNRNFRVSGGAGESYLLKQGIAADSTVSLANEVAVYRRLAAGEGSIASCIPRLYGYDAERGVLILEWIAGAQDLYRYHAARGCCSVALGGAVGRALAALHAVTPDEEEFRRDAPWVLSLHRPQLDALRYLSAASIELIKVIQEDERFGRGLDELREGWCIETLVHRDVKWENCVAHARPGGVRLTRVKLVDWEMAGWGDPGFDVGSAFSDVLGFWLASMPVDGDLLDEHRERSLQSLRPATAAFWRAYTRARGLDPGQASRLLLRSIRYAAARLVQSAYEHTQETPLMTKRVAGSLQLSRDMLLQPRKAATDLLGISW
ncbi:MAG TPA: aminoglycoside phosphotransferase family protein [Solirubrobacteraceae bacterium]|jgi:aminoglycoside phosphotransferase (APT) family kinase protein